MSTAIAFTKYKSCPLKKRPIIYEDATTTMLEQQTAAVLLQQQQQYVKLAAAVAVTDEQPQDLSLKRKAADAFEEYYCPVPAKREYALNLSKETQLKQSQQHRPQVQQQMHVYKYRPESPTSISSAGDFVVSSALLSPKVELDMDHQLPLVSDIHLRGLTAATNGYTTITTSDPYKSAFVLAAGATPMTALWSTYHPQSVNGMFPSPASSLAASSPHSVYSTSYQHMTPPSSPGSEADSEPEDLSLRSDIPLPALYHKFSEVPLKSAATDSSGKPQPLASSGTTVTTAKQHYRFKCDKCNKMYSTSIGLSKHQQFHCPAAECNQERKQHSCHECGKLYTTVGALKMHIRTHTLPCKCPICGKAFSRPWLLQGHIRTHTGEKPFHCGDCPRSFADRSNLRAHQQTHVEVKKYACKVCHKSFSRMSLLNKHVSSNCTITIL